MNWHGVKRLPRIIYRAVKWDGVWWVAGIAAVLATGVFLSWVYWADLRGGQDSLSATVRNLGLVVGGIIAILLAVWRSLVATRQAYTAQQSLLNERYQQGAEMLGSGVLSVRLGGIYALERLAAEHPEQYHVQVIKLFCAFVRNLTGSEGVPGKPYAEVKPPSTPPSLREDVQAVLTAIGGRSEAGVACEKATKNFHLELHGADLGGANLHRANLAGANLGGVNLVYATLDEADLSGADLENVNLYYASLNAANLTGTRLLSADLSHALAEFSDFSGTDLDCAKLIHAFLAYSNLSGANIGTADLSDAMLHWTNLSGATLSGGVVLTTHSYSDPPIREFRSARLAQKQLKYACAHPGNPPKLDGVVDIETGEPLVWRGRPLNDEP